MSDVGKNLFDKNNALNAYIGTYSILDNNSAKTVYCQCKPNTTYTVSKTAGERFVVGTTTDSPQAGTPVNNQITNNRASSITITTGVNDYYLVAYVWNQNVDTLTAQQMLDSVMVELGSTATIFEPYNGVTTTISLGQTVYGGEVDVVNGGGKSSFALIDLGTVNWAKDSQNRWFGVASPTTAIPGLKPISSNDQIASILCSNYKTTSRNLIISGDGICQNTNGSILIADSYMLTNYTEEQFKLAMSGVQLIYELATPTTFTTQPTPVKSLEGTNNLSVDCGEIIEVKYTVPKYNGITASRSTMAGTAINALTVTTKKPINQIVTGTGVAAQDKGSGVSPRYFPAKWTYNLCATATDGDIITIKIPVAGHDYGVYMSIDNGANYYPIVVSGSTRLTTNYGVNTYITVVFEPTGSASSMLPLNGGDSRVTVTGGVWRVINFYDTNTKNTAGSTDTSSKIYLVGATSQAANPQTYSDNEVFATSGVLTTKSVQVGGGSATIQYNTTTNSIDFIFAN